MDQQYSDDEADTPSVFEYAYSASSDEDVEMLDSDSSAYDVQSLLLKRAHGDDTDISSEARRTKRRRRLSSSRSTTTSGPSSPVAGQEQSSKPFSEELRGGIFPTYYDDRSAEPSQRPAEGNLDNPLAGSPNKHLKFNYFTKPCATAESTSPFPLLSQQPIPYTTAPTLLPDLTYSQGTRSRPCLAPYGNPCEVRAWKEAFGTAQGGDIFMRTSGTRPYETRYSRDDPRCKAGKELSVEDVRRILRKGGS